MLEEEDLDWLNSPEALTWFEVLKETEDDTGLINDALRAIDDTPSRKPDMDACYNALAAAELIAALLGNAPNNIPNDAYYWVEQYKLITGDTPVGKEFQRMTRRVVQRIKDDSGLKDKWDETIFARRWQDRMGDLIHRLHGAYHRRN